MNRANKLSASVVGLAGNISLQKHVLKASFRMALLIGLTGAALAESPQRLPPGGRTRAVAATTPPGAALQPPEAAEKRLREVYQLAADARSQEALRKAQSLVKDYPHFQLAQLVYGDLLSARNGPVRTIGDVPSALLKQAMPALTNLREESRLRMAALKERPREGAIPEQFVALSAETRHAIAVDGAKSRLYLFENGPGGMRLIADFYSSIGKAGLEKNVEGDSRTPLGVYFITGTFSSKTLGDFYGAGALPINYPNMLDRKRGKTGTGIWLHGTPMASYSRPPLDTNGCVVLSNPDLMRVMQTVEAGSTTPVVIASQLQWVMPDSVKPAGKAFDAFLNTWKSAKASGNVERMLDSYASDFNSYGRTLKDWRVVLEGGVGKLKGRTLELKNVSMLHWVDSADTMVVTFDEMANNAPLGTTTRQYWSRQGGQWKIFFEGPISRPVDSQRFEQRAFKSPMAVRTAALLP